MIVYKVARLTNSPGVYKSIIVEGQAEVIYTLNKRAYAPRWLSRKGNYLCVFSSLDMAWDWVILNCRITGVILKCNAGTICKKLGPECSIYHLGRGKIRPWPTSDYWPEGTLMVKTVVPLQEVDKKD